MAPKCRRPAAASGGPPELDQLSRRDRAEDSPQTAGPQLPITVAIVEKGNDEVRVTIDRYMDTPTIDVRIFTPFTMAQVPMPTKRGVTLAIGRLPEVVRALQDAEKRARELGLIGGGE